MPDTSSAAQQLKQLEDTVLNLEQQLNSLYLQAGKSMLETAEQTARQANALTEKMIAAKKLLARARGHTRCPTCQTLNPPTNRYCGCCGTKINIERKTS